VVEPRSDLSHAANLLWMMEGGDPPAERVRYVESYLVLLADHGLNASTFAARVTAATLSDIYSSVTSGIGALKGPLHGGANEDVIRMLLEAGSESAALQHVHDRLNTKRKIPGFGHRVYRTEDPRATHLRAMSEELGKRTGHLDLYLTSKKIEQTMKQLGDGVLLCGHSVGAYILLKLLVERQATSNPAGIFLIATPFVGGKGWQLEGALEKSFAAKLPRQTPIFLYHCRDDTVVPFDHLLLYEEEIPQATVRIFNQGGHQLDNNLSRVAEDIRRIS